MYALKCALLCAVVVVFSLFVGFNSVKDASIASVVDTEIVPKQSSPIEHSVPASETDRHTIAERYGKLPMHFEPNVGQTDASVKFLARGHGYSLFLTGSETVLSLRSPAKGGAADAAAIVRMRVEGADPASEVVGLDAGESRSNYFIGSDPSKWHTDVPNYDKVRYSCVLPGVDAVYYGNGQQLEYDFVVSPGTDPKSVKLLFDGLKSAAIDDKTGDLVLETGAGPIRQLKPVVYQNTEAGRSPVAAAYNIQRMDGQYAVSFNIAKYDTSRELIIDPVLAYGSYLGGNAFDEGRSIAVDAGGNAYVVGTAASVNFPTTAGVIKPAVLPSSNNQFWYDAFVTKVNPTGTALVFSTYYGGNNGSETGAGVALDAAGNILLSGTTMANDLPLMNPYQSTFGGTDDAFAAKLDPTGSAIIYSTYLGGNNTDLGGRVAVNQTTGDAVFTGFASSPNFPTTPGAYKERLCNGTPGSCNGIFYSGSYLVKLTASGSIVYSTLFDAAINDVALDSGDNATIGGSVSSGLQTTPGAFQPATSGGIEGFIAKMNPAGNGLAYATYLGGGLQSDRVTGIVLDSAQNIYVTGRTENTGFPVTPGVIDQTFNGNEDGFITKLNPAGSALVYSTFFGGIGKDQPTAIGLGADDEVFIAGETLSGAGFPLRNSLNGTIGSIFLSRVNADATSIVFSTLLGQGGAYDLAVDSSSGAYITGHTVGIGMIISPTAFQPIRNRNPDNISSKDAFVLKISPSDENATHYSISGMVTDENAGFNNNYKPVVVTITGTVNRSINIGYNGGTYFFGALPAGGTYTVTVSKIGFVVTPSNAVFTNLGANQSADFTILRNHEPESTITSPVHGTTYTVPATVTIQATATDPDGDPIQQVEFVAYSSSRGNVPLGIDTTAPYEFTWTDIPVDTWALYAIPMDSKGLIGQTQNVVHIFVVDGGAVTVAFAEPTDGQTVVEGDYVPIRMIVSPSVTAVNVKDENNQIVAWLTGPPWSSTWRVFELGQHTLTATASNAQGQTATAVVHINVTPINHVITGRVMDNITTTGIPGIVINLTSPTNPSITATATTNANGEYSFSGLGTTPNDGVVITPQSAAYTFDPPTRSMAYLGFINWPNQNFFATATTSIEVQMTSPTDGQTFSAPASFDLAATASSMAGTITEVGFYRRNLNGSSTLIAADTTAPYSFPLTNVAAGSYIYFARATDSTGAMRESEVVHVTVTAPPTSVRLQGDVTNSGGGWMPGVTVRLTGTVNGNTIEQTSVSNFFGAYGFFNLPAGGDYTITPQPTTITFTPTSVSFTNVLEDHLDIDFVASAINQAPSVTINSPLDGAVYTMPVAIPVSATATDPDGQVVHLSLSAVGNSQSYTIGQSLNGNFSALWQPNQPGTYTIWATARDNGGLQTSTNIQITVNPPSPINISGRAVDRNSDGIEGATLELRDYNLNEVVATATSDAAGNYTIANVTTFRNYVLRASKEDYSFSPQQRIFFNLNQSLSGIDYTGTLQVQRSDFDGDSETDISVWRPSTGVWYVNRSSDNGYTSSQFGGGAFGDIVTPGNFDGDQKIDYAVYRNGTWYILNSRTGSVRIEQFGLADDKPVAADFDGDGKTDIAVWRPSNGVWYTKMSSTSGYDFRYFGTAGDMPVAADYDGDGIADTAVWRPSSGTWYVMQSTNGSLNTAVFGTAGDMPLTGDFDGDKRSDFTVFRPSNGYWYVLKSTDGAPLFMQWGARGDMPVPGDYDRDGKTDCAIFRDSNQTWYIRPSTGQQFIIRQFGLSGDIPIPSAYIQ